MKSKCIIAFFIVTLLLMVKVVSAYITYDRRGEALLTVPRADIPADTELLILIDHEINRIEDFDLANLPSLKQVTLTHNNISYFSPRAFENSTQVQKLGLEYNQLTCVCPWLKSIGALDSR